MSVDRGGYGVEGVVAAHASIGHERNRRGAAAQAGSAHLQFHCGHSDQSVHVHFHLGQHGWRLTDDDGTGPQPSREPDVGDADVAVGDGDVIAAEDADAEGVGGTFWLYADAIVNDIRQVQSMISELDADDARRLAAVALMVDARGQLQRASQQLQEQRVLDGAVLPVAWRRVRRRRE